METIKNAINLLNAVHSTMDSISVIGIDNQDKFVGCANAIQTVSKALGKFLQEAQKEQAQTVSKVNGDHPDSALNINTEEAANG